MRYLLDPALFSRVIIALFVLAAIRWAFAGNWPQVVYWLSGAALNIAVLMMAPP